MDILGFSYISDKLMSFDGIFEKVWSCDERLEKF